MKRILSIVMFSVSFCVSYAQISNKRAIEKGFLNSRSYKDYLDKYNNKSEILYSDKRFFNLIGEESFLSDCNCSSYAIYLSSSNGGELNIYILKSKDGISSISFKQLHKTSYLFSSNQNSPNDKLSYKLNVTSKIITIQNFREFNNSLSSYTKRIKDRLPDYSEGSLKLLFYFDGVKYYRISKFQIEPRFLNELDMVKHADDGKDDKKIVLTESRNPTEVDDAINKNHVVSVHDGDDLLKKADKVYDDTKKDKESAYVVAADGATSSKIDGNEGDVDVRPGYNELSKNGKNAAFDIHGHTDDEKSGGVGKATPSAKDRDSAFDMENAG